MLCTMILAFGRSETLTRNEKASVVCSPWPMAHIASCQNIFLTGSWSISSWMILPCTSHCKFGPDFSYGSIVALNYNIWIGVKPDIYWLLIWSLTLDLNQQNSLRWFWLSMLRLQATLQSRLKADIFDLNLMFISIFFCRQVSYFNIT